MDEIGLRFLWKHGIILFGLFPFERLELIIVAQKVEDQRVEAAAPSIHKGPVEGVLIVNGRPRMERADMPCISFESILALQRYNEDHK